MNFVPLHVKLLVFRNFSQISERAHERGFDDGDIFLIDNGVVLVGLLIELGGDLLGRGIACHPAEGDLSFGKLCSRGELCHIRLGEELLIAMLE